MLVNATQFPGPALWQGLMFLCLCWYLPWAFSNDMRNFKWATLTYAGVGVLLFVLIVINS